MAKFLHQDKSGFGEEHIFILNMIAIIMFVLSILLYLNNVYT